MKTKQEIEQLAETYTNKIVEVAYHNFPLVPTKEEVSKIITALLVEYTNQCQEDTQKDIEYWQGEADHWQKQAMEMASINNNNYCYYSGLPSTSSYDQ